MKKIVVTGANGFVGSHIANKLYDSEVVYLVRPGSDVSLIKADANIKYIDYNNDSKLLEIVKDTDILIHSAALTRSRSWEQFQKVNVDLTTRLLDICNKCMIKHFIFLSSQAVCGPSNDINNKVSEKDKANPVTMYGRSKLLAERYIINNSKIPYTIIRAVSIYGEGDKDFLQLFKMVHKRIVFINGFRKKFYNLMYIDELTSLINKSIMNKKLWNEIVIAANPSLIENKELYKMIGNVIGKKIVIFKVPELLLYPIAFILEMFSKIFKTRFPVLNRDKVKEFRKFHWIVDASKINKLLNIEFDNCHLKNFRKTYNWYKKNGWI